MTRWNWVSFVVAIVFVGINSYAAGRRFLIGDTGWAWASLAFAAWWLFMAVLATRRLIDDACAEVKAEVIRLIDKVVDAS